MDRTYMLTERISRGATWIGGGMLLLSAAIITVDVILRKLINFSLGGSDEIAGYALAISTSWGLSFTLMSRANIRIDALYMRLPARMTAWLDLLAMVTMACFMAFVAWFTAQLWMGSISMNATANTPLQTPLMIPQGLWVMGFALFLLVSAVMLVRMVRMLAAGDSSGVGRMAGIRSVDEEVQDEVADVLEQIRAKGGRHAA